MSLNKDAKFKVWENVLLEQNLCEDLDKISNQDRDSDLMTKIRGIESYFYQNEPDFRHSNDKSVKNHLILPIITTSNTETNEIKDLQVKNRINRLTSYDERKSRNHIHATEYDSDKIVIKEISRCLRESNIKVITRCINVLGKKKSLELLYATEDIIEKGGMLTVDGNRKRTAGGIYLQLVKNDETILNCQRSQILIKEEYQKKKKNEIKRLKRKLKTQYCKIIDDKNDDSNNLNKSIDQLT